MDLFQEFQVDINEYDPSDQGGGSFDPLPDGIYEAMIVDAESKTTRDGLGKYLNLTLQIVQDGPYKNRLVWDALNLVNRNAKAQEIARQRLLRIQRICGAKTNNVDEILQRVLLVKLGTEPAKDGYDARNRVKSYEDPGQPAGQAAGQAWSQPPAQPAAPGNAFPGIAPPQ